MPLQSGSWLSFMKQLLNIQRSIPKEYAVQFEEYKDISAINRLQTAAWLGFTFAICMFGLDIYRYNIGEFHGYKQDLFYFHLVGVLFIVFAIHIGRNKEWIIQTRLRRGIVIWGMVLMCMIFLLAHSVVIYWERGTTILYLGYVFAFVWMFAMSNNERLVFLLVSTSAMGYAIITKTGITTEERIVSFIEVFFLTLMSFFFDAFDYQMKATNFLDKLQIEGEQKRIRQLEEFKSKFYTNLTHEFRTPLTLIIGMAREVAENPARWVKEGTDTIKHHADSLLQLINQMLDLSKIESGTLGVNMVQGNMVTFQGYIIDSFRGPAFSKKITLHYLTESDRIQMDYDPEKIKTIVGNLISNALKFSPEGTNIYVSLTEVNTGQQESIEIAIRDQGIGIPKEDIDHIFERYYQVNTDNQHSGTGTGIGLSLVHELIELFNGKISVTSTVGKGTQFKILLPITRRAPLINQEQYVIQANIQSISTPVTDEALWELNESSAGDPDVLIIEDNADVQRYLKICLGDLYQLHFSSGGAEGLKKAIDNVPDLILSDVMMPGIDGITLSKELKKNPATSHIPIILLSARADVASKVAGLESGADAYLTKPFDKDELRAQIQNLLDRFKEFHARYANPEKLETSPVNESVAVEDEFITRVRNVVHEHLDDADFSVHDLERKVFLSRSQLHKKLKALTGLSAMQFVSRIRLSIAREKLMKNGQSISEIAYEVGFSDPNYFTRVYTEEFGETPTATRNRFKTNII